MKKSILLLIAGAFFAQCKKDPYVAPPPPPSKIEGLQLEFRKTNIASANPRSLLFLNESTGFIADYGGALYRTTDGGASWTNLLPSNNLPLFDICFLNNSEGFVVGGERNCGGTGCQPRGAIMYHTADGGQTWEQVPLSLSQKVEMAAIDFVNDTLGYAVGGGLVLITHNRGASWQETVPPNAGTVYTDVKFTDAKNGLIVGPGGKVLKTTDGGANWAVSAPFMYGGVNTLNYAGNNIVFATAGGMVYKSSDFGAGWTEFKNLPQGISSTVFKTENEGFSFGLGDYVGGESGMYYGSIYYTTDGGLNWRGSTQIREMNGIQGASMPDKNTVFAISGQTLVKIKRL